MKKLRAISTGALVWLFIFIMFAILGYVPILKDSLDRQAIVVGVFIVPFAIYGASVYYRNGSRENGLIIGLVMATTALVLDAIVTVPLIEIPKGGSYQGFYTYPLLWLLVAVNIATVYFYWRLKIQRSRP